MLKYWKPNQVLPDLSSSAHAQANSPEPTAEGCVFRPHPTPLLTRVDGHFLPPLYARSQDDGTRATLATNESSIRPPIGVCQPATRTLLG